MTTHQPTRILVAYHSGEGQTAKIASRIAGLLRDGGAEVEMLDAEYAPSPVGFDGVVAGDSIHAGRHSKELRRWLADHSTELAGVPVALFQVSLTSATDDEEHSAEALRMLHELVADSGIDPDIVGLFAGALVYTRYGWLKRKLMSSIARREGGDSDPSRDYEYTDWDAVDHFAGDSLALMTNGFDARGVS